MDYCRCLPCFGHTETDSTGEREPLIPKHIPPTALPPPVDSRSQLDKIVDALAALNAGKLPSQEQFVGWLRYLLKSDLLKSNVVGKLGSTFPGGSGTGPTSRQGQKVILDVREVVESLIQFGMEKNVDDKLQDLYFKLTQEDLKPIDVHLNANVDAQAALRATSSVLNTAQEGASDVLDEVPTTSQIKFDFKTLLSAVRTLFTTTLTSPVFRLAFIDLLSIAREVIAHAAQDVERIADDVHDAAKVIEDNARSDDVIAVDVGQGLESNPKIKTDLTVEDVRIKTKEVVEEVKEEVGEIKDEWKGTAKHVEEEVKEKLILRMKEVLTRIQQDPAARSAMRAILTLFTKYSQSFSEISSAAADAVVDVATEVKEDITSATKTSEGTTYPSNGDAVPGSPKPPKHVYPPTHPYVDPKLLVDITAREVLLDIKDVLERLGGRHSLDGLVENLAQLVRCVNEVPGVLVDEVEELVEEKVGSGEEGGDDGDGVDTKESGEESTSTAPLIDLEKEIPVPKAGHPKSRKEKRKERHHKVPSGPSLSGSHSGSGSGSERSKSEEYEQSDGVEGRHTGTLSDHARQQQNRKKEMNPIRGYLIEIGEFFEQSLDESDPGWVLSQEGSETLERIIADGVDLFQVVGESVAQVGEAAVSGEGGEGKRPASREEDIKSRFRTSLHGSLVSLDAYISALQHDRSTMRLVNSFTTLHASFTSLFSVAASQTAQTAFQARNKTLAFGLQSYAIDWIAYMLPKMLRMLPSNFIPLPSVEVKSGTLEAGLYGSFVQGLARHRGAEPLRTSLVPDEVVVRQWTEVRLRPNDVNEQTRTTSRVSVHMDGVRAKLEDVGYFFKYAVGSGGLASWVGYEDEGLVSVDLGLGGHGEAVHEGIGVDVELEMETGADDVDEDETADELLVIPKVTVQDVDAESGKSKTPVCIALPPPTQEVEDVPPLFRVISTTLHLRSLKFEINRSRHWIVNKLVFQPLSGPLVSTLVEKALQAKVKSGLEALGKGLGLLAREAGRKSVERKAETGQWKQQDTWTDMLGDWYKATVESGPKAFGYEAAVESADSNDEVAEDENEEGEPQTTTTTGLHPTAKGLIWSSTTTVDPSGEGEQSKQVDGEADEDTEDESPTPKASQPRGHPPMVYKKSTASMERVDMDAVKEREGVLNGNGHGAPSLNMNGTGPQTSTDHDNEGHGEDESESEVVSETLVAIGAQPQLFPSKGGIDGYGSTSTTERFDDEAAAERQALLDDVEQGIETAVRGVKKGKAKLDNAGDTVGEAGRKAQGAERRFEERVEVEKRAKTRSAKGWRSEAFDF